MSSPFSVGAVLLAAGQSRRMGRPKLLLAWQGTSVLGHLVAQWRLAGAGHLAIVCAAGDQAIQGELDRLGFPGADRIFNPAPERGMFSSIQCAAQWPGWPAALTHFAIVLGDQPHVRQATLRAMLEFSAAHPGRVCQPARAGRRRHPVLLPKAVFLDLGRSKAANLRAFLSPCQAATCELADPGLDLDIDCPADYEAALALGGGEALER
ncbi:MAG: nucleotidyltransferase family protein [Verrucomicrobiota bacterium]